LVGGLAFGEHVAVAGAECDDGGWGVHGDIDAQQNLGAYESRAAAIDGFDTADIIFQHDVFVFHPSADCAGWDEADSGVGDVGNLLAFGFDDENGDVNIEDGGEIHGDGLNEFFEIAGFDKGEHRAVDALLVVHVRAGGFDNGLTGRDRAVFIGLEALNHVGLKVGDAFVSHGLGWGHVF